MRRAALPTKLAKKQIGIMFKIKSGGNYLGGMRKAPSSLMQQPLSIVFSMM